MPAVYLSGGESNVQNSLIRASGINTISIKLIAFELYKCKSVMDDG